MSEFGFGYGWGSRRRRRGPVTPVDPAALTTEADEEIQTEAAEPILVQPP